ncbi:hypothetical protein ColTof4_14059 [Colletotrichum tofieldiae]|nr:hypothetical protein ColTof3_14695 [Colletotrichum tofieldiae]GKT81636.1 hypothetical protein ColTof4_14059 [Colletotrichum tofieldiae]
MKKLLLDLLQQANPTWMPEALPALDVIPDLPPPGLIVTTGCCKRSARTLNEDARWGIVGRVAKQSKLPEGTGASLDDAAEH